MEVIDFSLEMYDFLEANTKPMQSQKSDSEELLVNDTISLEDLCESNLSLDQYVSSSTYCLYWRN